MKNITIDPKALAALKDEVFDRAVEQHTAWAIKTVLAEEASRTVFNSGGHPQILSEPDDLGYVWVGNEYIRVMVNMAQFNKEVALEVASNI